MATLKMYILMMLKTKNIVPDVLILTFFLEPKAIRYIILFALSRALN